MSDFSLIFVCEASRSEPVKDHTHQYVELALCVEGRAVFDIDGQAYEIQSGDIGLVELMERHGMRFPYGPCRFICLGIAVTPRPGVPDEERLLFALRGFAKRENPVLPLGDKFGRVRDLMRSIVREYSERPELCEWMIPSLTDQLLIELSRLIPKQDKVRESRRTQAKVLAIRQYIDEHFAEDLTVEQLAKQHDISADYLTKCFRSLTGYTPKQYITSTRLIAAHKLLTTADCTVDSVARQVGFFNVNNFIRSFRGFYGETPGVCGRAARKK